MTQKPNVPTAPVQARVVVPGAEDRAFEVFTGAFGEWWPLRTHSVFGTDAATCVFEPRAGGRIYERHTDGRESPWGTVLECEPGSRVRFTWHPGRGAETAQEITLRFEPMMFGTTVTLEHGQWENAGEKSRELRSSYERNWPGVLDAYAKRVSRA